MRLRDARQTKRVRQRRKGLEGLPPNAQRLLEKRLAVAPKQIEDDETNGNLRAEEQVPFPASKPLLQLGERQHLLAAHRQELAIQDPVPGQIARRIRDLEKRARDFLQIARVKRNALADLVQLAANAVVFILDPNCCAPGSARRLHCAVRRGGLRTARPTLLRGVVGSKPAFSRHSLPNVRRGLLGRREHEFHRAKRDQTRLRQPPLLRQPRRLANVAEQQVRPPHGFQRDAERRRDRLLHQPLLQSDAQVAGENFDEKFPFQRRAASQGIDEQGQLGRRPARAVQLLEQMMNRIDGQSRSGRARRRAQRPGRGRRGSRRSRSPACVQRQDFERRLAAVAVLEISPAQFVRREAANGAQRFTDQRPAKLQHLVPAGREWVSGKPGGHPRQRLPFECLNIFRQQTDFFPLAADTANGGAGFGECRERGLARHGGRREQVPGDFGFRPALREGFGFFSRFAAAAAGRQRQRQLFLLAQCTRVEPHLAQRPRKVRGKTVEGENSFRRDALHEFDETGKIRMIAQRKRRVGSIAKPAIRIDRPAGEHRGAHPAELAQRGRQVRHRRANQHFASRGPAVKLLVSRKLLAELLINLRELENRFVQQNRQTRVRQPAQQLLAFAERIAEQHRRLVIVNRLATKARHTFQHLARRRELILRPAVSRLHDERVRPAGARGLARFRGQTLAQFEIAGVKQGFAPGFDQAHRAAENMAGGQQGDLPANAAGLERCRLVEGQNLFLARAAEPRLHERRGRRARDHFSMLADVVAVRVADEDAVSAGLRLARVEPQFQRRQINAAAVVLERHGRHRDNLAVESPESRGEEGFRGTVPSVNQVGRDSVEP